MRIFQLAYVIALGAGLGLISARYAVPPNHRRRMGMRYRTTFVVKLLVQAMKGNLMLCAK